jgi:hypothetical protein
MEKIIRFIESVKRQEIIPEKILILFDEVQAKPSEKFERFYGKIQI